MKMHSVCNIRVANNRDKVKQNYTLLHVGGKQEGTYSNINWKQGDVSWIDSEGLPANNTHIYAAQVPETGQTCGLATLVATATQQ